MQHRDNIKGIKVINLYLKFRYSMAITRFFLNSKNIITSTIKIGEKLKTKLYFRRLGIN